MQIVIAFLAPVALVFFLWSYAASIRAFFDVYPLWLAVPFLVSHVMVWFAAAHLLDKSQRPPGE